MDRQLELKDSVTGGAEGRSGSRSTRLQDAYRKNDHRNLVIRSVLTFALLLRRSTWLFSRFFLSFQLPS